MFKNRAWPSRILGLTVFAIWAVPQIWPQVPHRPTTAGLATSAIAVIICMLTANSRRPLFQTIYMVSFVVSVLGILAFYYLGY